MKRAATTPASGKRPARARATPASADPRSVQLEITLRYSQPRIWRTIVVPAGIKLHQLHAVLQIVMGWTDSHLHEFRHGERRYAAPSPIDDDWGDEPALDESGHTLAELVQAKGDSFRYDYDFGDSWTHDVAAVRIESVDTPRAVCLAGENACPPEDCGGIPGYYEMLEALRDRKHPEHAEIREWIGEDFDPARFELEEVNAQLRRLRLGR
ncbi:MAG: plasmid pRiA4b ORF-3 family protein [Opitutaceae bacterium]